MYPAAANCAAEISIKCSRNQLGICAQKRCEDPVTAINKISINVDKKCVFHWGKAESGQFQANIEKLGICFRFRELKHIGSTHLFTEGCLIHAGIMSQVE